MSGFTLRVRLDPASLERLYAFENYQAILEPALEKAMDAGIAMLQAYASDYMWSHFINPTGPTEDDSWEVDMQGPYLAILTNTAPQGQRLEYGFSQMTDSLGRYYEYWPAYYWASATVLAERPKIRDVFQAAIDYANLTLGRGVP